MPKKKESDFAAMMRALASNDVTPETVELPVEVPVEEVPVEETLEEMLAGIEAEVLAETEPETVSADSTESEPEPEIDYEFQSQILLHGLEESLKGVEEQYQSTDNDYQRLIDEKAALNKQLTELAKRISAIEGVRYDYQSQMRRFHREINEAQQEVEREKANKDAEENLKKLASTFEHRTRMSPWRVGFKDTWLRGEQIRVETPVLYPHQMEAAKAIAAADGRFLLADGMGLGKTPECLAGFSMLDEGSIVDDVLIDDGTMPGLNILAIVPGEIQHDFFKAVNRWTYYDAYMIGRETKADQKRVFDMIRTQELKGQFVIVNYETWSRNKTFLNWAKSVGFDAVVCDEAHRIKDYTNQTFRGVSDIVNSQNKCPKCESIFSDETDWMCPNHCTERSETGWEYAIQPVSSVKHFLAMTGTFILNNPQEMFASLHLARPDIFRHHSTFASRFVDWTGKAWNAGGQARLAQEISGFYMRRTRDDAGIVLPKQTEYVHEIEIQQEEYELQYQLLDMLRKDAEIQIQQGDLDGATFPINNLLELILRQRQATVWPGGIYMNLPETDPFGIPIWDSEGKPIIGRVHVGANYQQSAKMDKAVELWSEMRDGGMRVAVFSQFREALNEFQRRVEEMGSACAQMHGGASKEHRKLVKENFDRMQLTESGNKPIWDTVVCHYKTGGEGLNLTAATGMIILDEPWNEATEDQAMGRLDRIGQTEESQVHILRHSGPQKSIDLWLAAILELKADVVAGLNKATEYRKAFH